MEDWRTWAAVWGAITGTIALLLSLLSSRPRFVLTPDGQGGAQRICIKVYNPSALPLQVSRVSIIPPGIGVFPMRKDDSGRTMIEDWMETAETGRFYLFVEPRSERQIRINTITRWCIILLWWHRFTLLPIRLPKIVLISPSVAQKINRGSV